jgi:HEAT repeat protein
MTPSRSDKRPDIAALAKAGNRAALRAALRHRDAAIRARAADALAQLGDLESVPPLRLALRADDDDHVREEAAVALGRLGDLGSVNDLIAALEHDQSSHVREEAALALGRLGDERAIVVLLGAMDDRQTMVHRAAVEALGFMGADAMERLMALAHGPRTRAADAARAALQAVGELNPRAHGATPPINRTASSGDIPPPSAAAPR